MRVVEVRLRHFRNILRCEFRPDRHLNFLLGSNGQGKTSVIEALGYLSELRSFRGAKIDELVSWNTPEAEITARLEGDEGWAIEISIALYARPGGGGSRVVQVNGKKAKSATDYLAGRLGPLPLGVHAVVFNPSDHDLIRGEPAGRRAFIDRALSAEDGEYLRRLSRYQRLLTQRNALLKEGAERGLRRDDVLEDFTVPMTELAAQLTSARLQWIDVASKSGSDYQRQIAPRQGGLRLDYLSKWVPGELRIEGNHGQGSGGSLEPLKQAFRDRWSELRDQEWRAGVTLFGPHRDDWALRLGDQPLKGHGSQGEVRSALLALKMAEIDLFRRRTGHRPILLLDDFSSELDRERREYLLRYLTETDLQVFVTSTEESIRLGRRYRLVEGALRDEADG